MNWERNNGLFIMINEEGSITPIYKDPNDLPQAIVNYIENLAESYEENSPSREEILNEIRPFEGP